jgi:adenosine deaminase
VSVVDKSSVGLGVCLTSNVFTGAARSIAEHPLRQFLVAGCRVVVGDDNPVNVGTTLSAEERRLETEAGLTAEQVHAIQRTACEVAFTDEATRAGLRGKFAG